MWFTGVRREEAPTRANTPLVVWDERNGLVKVNPVAAWTFDDLLDYAGAHEVPVNLLVSNGDPFDRVRTLHSRPVAPGDDPAVGSMGRALENRMRAPPVSALDSAIIFFKKKKKKKKKKGGGGGGRPMLSR